MKKFSVIFVMIITMFLYGCKSDSVQNITPVSCDIFAMDTYMNIKIYGNDNARALLNESVSLISELEKKWSVTDENSEIYEINHSNGKSVVVSEETAELIGYSLSISDLTNGALDCTIYPLLTLWGFTSDTYRIPDETEISTQLKNIGYEKIKLENNIVTIPEDMQIDMGATAKGYTGDLIAEKLKENGITSALLDLGGNIQTIGTKPDGTKWKLGLRNPFGDDSFATLEVSECAVITSGGYERYFTGDDGEIYWHILDSQTGKPAKSGLVSVTVIGKEGKLCDALSTSLFVMGVDKAMELWKQRYDFEMVLVTDDKKIYLTEGLEESFSLNQIYSDLQTEVIHR